MKKIIFLILLFFLLILGVAIIFIYQRGASQKAVAWNTYTDPTFDYSLQYPSSWQIRTIGKQGNIDIFNSDKNWR